MEGAHGLGPDAAYLDAAIADGFRMIGLAHFFDNDFAGSLHGTTKHGLTPAGRDLIARLDAAEIIIDLAHSSPAVVDEVLALSRRPPVVSHTGIRGACDSPRNLTDGQMKRIADAGGLIGIGFWEGAICDTSPAGIAAHLLAAVAMLGVDHVSLGSDWDGTISTTVDAARLPQLTQALLDAGASEETITAVMGGNLVAFLEENLPDAEETGADETTAAE
jgi:membrane dipeptidase